MAATLYEPAFALTTRWFGDRPGQPSRSGQRARAVLLVTVCGGLASTVFVPLCGVLITVLGWRDALVALAVIAAVVGLPIHALLLRDGPGPDDAPPVASGSRATRRVSFRWLTLSLVAATAAKNGLSVVLVAYLVARGYPLPHAAAIAGAVGAAQVGGRLLATTLRARVPEHRTHSTIFFAQGAACLLPLATTGTGPAASATLWIFVVVFGVGFGLPELLRGTLVVDLYGAADYPRVNGVLSTWVVTARALGPLLAGVLVTATAGYTWALVGAALLCVLGASTLLAAHRAHGREVGAADRPSA